MTKVIQAIATLSQDFRSKTEIMVQKKANLRLALSLSGITALLLFSYLNGGLFMDKLVIVSAIVCCILLVKTMGDH